MKFTGFMCETHGPMTQFKRDTTVLLKSELPVRLHFSPASAELVRDTDCENELLRGWLFPFAGDDEQSAPAERDRTNKSPASRAQEEYDRFLDDRDFAVDFVSAADSCSSSQAKMDVGDDLSTCQAEKHARREDILHLVKNGRLRVSCLRPSRSSTAAEKRKLKEAAQFCIEDMLMPFNNHFSHDERGVLSDDDESLYYMKSVLFDGDEPDDTQRDFLSPREREHLEKPEHTPAEADGSPENREQTLDGIDESVGLGGSRPKVVEKTVALLGAVETLARVLQKFALFRGMFEDLGVDDREEIAVPVHRKTLMDLLALAELAE